MNIYILEDDRLQRKKLRRLIEDISIEKNILIDDLFDTASPTNLIRTVESRLARGTQMLYFLDIEIKDDKTREKNQKKGFEVAQHIRKIDRFANIVFVTTHSEFAVVTYSYQISALQFIKKDQPELLLKEQINSCLEYVLEYSYENNVPEDVFQFATEYKKFQIPFSEVLYFETLTQPHKVAIVTVNQRIEFYSNLAKIEKSDKRLIRCHKSFVVNADSIVDIDNVKGIIRMKGDAICYLARRKYRTVRDWKKV